MRQHLQILLLTFVIFLNCEEKQTKINAFSSSQDTLIVEMTKIKGNGLFNLGAGDLIFKTGTEWANLIDGYNSEYIFPESVKDSKIGLMDINLQPFRYYDTVNDETISSIIDKKNNHIGILKGSLSDKNIFIVDENNNRDFSDDSVRVFNEWNWFSDDNLITCHYTIDKKGKRVRDSSWVKIGTWKGKPLKSTSQYLKADFSIDNVPYALGVADENVSSFCFFKPGFALVEENKVKRDTLLRRDMLQLKAHVKLGKHYYKINNLYTGSKTIELVKSKGVEHKIGIQLGTTIPDFEFVSTAGDTLHSDDYMGSRFLIVNVSACTSKSFQVYDNITQAIGKDLKIIGIDYCKQEKLSGTIVDMKNEFNNEMYTNFRNAYSSYDCYLVDEYGKISDIFSIFNWKSHLTGLPKDN